MSEIETPRQTQPTESKFLKISRALDGSDFWNQRLEIALEISELETSRANKISITQAVVDSIDATEDGSVFTDRVTDEQIINAITDLTET